MHPLVQVIVVLIFGAFFIWALVPKPVFVIAIRNGEILVKKGKVPHQFLRFCLELAEAEGLPDSTIRGFRAARGIGLRFSRSLPHEYHQRLRNSWSSHG